MVVPSGDPGGRTSSEVVADLVPGAHLVTAFNILTAADLGAEPHTSAGRRVIFLSGDHAGADDRITRLIEGAGWAAIDLGPLASAASSSSSPAAVTTAGVVRIRIR